MSNYIKIGNTIINKYKILSVVARPSKIYIQNPYVLTIEYAQRNDPVYFGFGFCYVPVTEKTIEYKWKLRTKEDILYVYNNVKNQVTDDTLLYLDDSLKTW